MQTLPNHPSNIQEPTVGIFYRPQDSSLESTANTILTHFQKEDLMSRCKIFSKDSSEEINKNLLVDLFGEQLVHSLENPATKDKTKQTIFSKDASAQNRVLSKESLAACESIKLAVDEVVNRKVSSALTVSSFDGADCFSYDDVAIAAKYTTKNLGFEKVLIFDWDVQFDQKSSKTFENDPSVLYISIHRFDKGDFLSGGQVADISNIGEGAGKGFNLNYGWNLPHNYYTIGDHEYVYALERIFLPIIQEFSPDFIFVSAGFGAAKEDSRGGLDLSVDGYAYMTKRLMNIAPGRTIFSLRADKCHNDYQLKCAEACLRALLNEQMPLKLSENEQTLEVMRDKCVPNEVGFDTAKQALDIYGKYWPVITQDQGLCGFEKCCKESSGSKTVEIAAGHLDAIIIKQDKIVKRLKEKEVRFYTELSNIAQGNYEGIEYLEETKMIRNLTAKCTGMTVINERTFAILENLCYKHPKASVIDFKLGRVTYSPDQSEEMKRQHIEKAEKTISSKLGFRVSGLILKDKMGGVAHKAYKHEIYYDIKTDNIVDYIEKFLKSNDSEKVNYEAVECYKKFLEEVIEFFEKKNSRAWIGTSILFVLDNTTNYYRASWIDIGKYLKLNEGEKDENSLEGLQSLYKILHTISESQKKL